MAGSNHFSAKTIAFSASQGVALASIAVPLSGVLAIRWRPEHFAGLSRETRRLAHCGVPDSGYLDVAQVLDGAGPDDGADYK